MARTRGGVELVEHETRSPRGVARRTLTAQLAVTHGGRQHPLGVWYQSDSQARVAARDVAGLNWRPLRGFGRHPATTDAHLFAGALTAEVADGVFIDWTPAIRTSLRVRLTDGGRTMQTFPFTTLRHVLVRAGIQVPRLKQRRARQARIDAVRAGR